MHLRRLSIASLLVLVLLLTSESNTEDTQLVTIIRRHFHITLNQSLPLLDQRTQLITSCIHTIEQSNTLVSLNILHTQSHLTETLLLILVQITKVRLENTTLQTLRSNLKTRSTRHQSLAHLTLLELVRGTNIVPLLLCHCIDHLLSLSLLVDLLLSLAYKIGYKSLVHNFSLIRVVYKSIPTNSHGSHNNT